MGVIVTDDTSKLIIIAGPLIGSLRGLLSREVLSNFHVGEDLLLLQDIQESPNGRVGAFHHGVINQSTAIGSFNPSSNGSISEVTKGSTNLQDMSMSSTGR